MKTKVREAAVSVKALEAVLAELKALTALVRKQRRANVTRKIASEKKAPRKARRDPIFRTTRPIP